jgi:hypothetical protein
MILWFKNRILSMPIYLDIKESREFLLKNKIVYTLMDKPLNYNTTDIRVGKDFYMFNKIGLGKVTFIKEIKETKELEKYVRQSGFIRVNNWLKETRENRFLHRVELI